MTVATLTHPRSDHDRSAAADSARRAGGPEDRALYECGCGTRFVAAVSTSVDCPDCGCGQAW